MHFCEKYSDQPQSHKGANLDSGVDCDAVGDDTRGNTKTGFSFATCATGQFLCYCNTLIRVPFHLVESGIMEFFIGLLVLLKSSSWHEK